MAETCGVSKASVQRIWQANGLKPHLVKTFKLSNDPHFIEKLEDVVGLYLNPPEHALVFCIDEKSQIQALDRTQPGLPMKKGRAGTMTHDYKRNGTTTLFAALDILKGEVIGQCMARHRHQEFLKFLKAINRTTRGISIFIVLPITTARISIRMSKLGLPNIPAFTSTLFRHHLRGSILSNAGSERSQPIASAAVFSKAWPSVNRPSMTISNRITQIRSHLSGQNLPMTSF